LNNYKKAVKFINFSLNGEIPFSSLYYNVSSIIENYTNNKEGFIALYKCLKRRIKTNPECIYSKLKFAALNVQINNYKEAIEV
jgi:hypothetical protein